MKENKKEQSRRKFIQQGAIAGVGLIITNPTQIFSQTDNSTKMSNNIKSKGYAGQNISDKLGLWEFERRPLDENDVLIEIKYSGWDDLFTIQS